MAATNPPLPPLAPLADPLENALNAGVPAVVDPLSPREPVPPAVALAGALGVLPSTPEPDPRPASTDRVEPGPSPLAGQLVAIFPRWQVLFVGDGRYVTAGALFRAIDWGRALFGAVTFALYEERAQPAPLFHVVPLTENIRASDLRLGATFRLPGAELRAYRALTEFWLGRRVGDRIFRLRAVVTADRVAMFPREPLSVARSYYDEQRRTPLSRRFVDDDRLRDHAFGPIDQVLGSGPVSGVAGDRLQAAADALAQLDETAFRLIARSTGRWARYVETLVRAWTRAPHEAALVALFKAAPDRQTLSTAFGGLPANVRLQLLSDLDSGLWSLFVEVGERFADSEFTLKTFLDTFAQITGLPIGAVIDLRGPDQPPVLRAEGMAQLYIAADELLDAAAESVVGLWELITEPEKLIEAVPQLVELGVTVAAAAGGHLPSILELEKLLSTVGKKAVAGYRGALFLGVPDPLLVRAKWVLLFTAVSWFVGAGEARAAVALRELGESIATFGRLLRVMRPLLSVGETAQLPQKLRRFAGLLGDEAETLRLLSRVRDEELTAFARLTRGVDISPTTTLDDLVAVSPEVADVVKRTRNQVEALRALLQTAGRLSDNAVKGFRRLVGARKISEENLIRLMRTLPPDNTELFMTAVNALPDAAFAGNGRSVGFFVSLAERPRAAEFLLTDGYAPFAALLKHARYDWGNFDEYLLALNRMGQNIIPSSQRPARYAELLVRLAAEENALLGTLDEARAAARLAAGRKVYRLFTKDELDDLVRTTPDIKAIRKLGLQMNPGSRGSLFERWLDHYVFKKDIGEERARMRLVDGDNEFEMLASSRTCDFLTNDEGQLILWDGKLYDHRTGIDVEQALDWQEANLLDKVVLRDPTDKKVEQTIHGVGYIFSERAAAEANLSKVMTWAGGEVWYIDDFGVLQLLR